jgi:Collagen triple helix repeat (20 copies)
MMLSAIRRRMGVSPTTVIASLALVFAMTGGAYAAGKYVITSTKQISPKVLKSLTGKAGVNGVNGAAGAQGPAGEQGPQGATGLTGQEGAPGRNGTNGVAGKEGPEGSPWTAGGTLPSGETETGAWALSASAEGAALASISFNIRLAHTLGAANVHFVKSSGDGSKCAGTVEAPTATPGNLCVYEGGFLSNLTFGGITTPSGAEGAGTAGAVLLFEAGAEAPRLTLGSWAVTAE